MEISLGFYPLDEMIDILIIADTDPWIGSGMSRSPEEIRKDYEEIFARRLDMRWPTVIARDPANGKVIGFALTTICKGNRAKIARVPADGSYTKLGILFVHPDYRGRGVGLSIAFWYKERHPKMAYFVDVENKVSEKVAVAIGLKYSHMFYAGKDNRLSFKPKPDHRAMKVYLS